MVSLVLITANLAIVATSFYNWKKYNDKIFFFVALIGLLTTLVGGLSYGRIVSLNYSILAFSLASAIMNWYNWKKFRDRQFFWYMLVSIGAILIVIYAFYIKI